MSNQIPPNLDSTIEAALITAAATVGLALLSAWAAVKNGWITLRGNVRVAEIESKDENRRLDIEERQALNDDLREAIKTYQEMTTGMRAEMKARDDEHAKERAECARRQAETEVKIDALNAKVRTLETENTRLRVKVSNLELRHNVAEIGLSEVAANDLKLAEELENLVPPTQKDIDI